MVLERNGKPLGELPIMSIENPTLAHFRHFSSLFTNDLQSTKDYVRNYKLFLQNEPKFRKVKLNVNKVLTKDYDQLDTWSIGKKQSQTKPIKANLQKAKMNVNKVSTKNYVQMDTWSIRKNEPKTNPNEPKTNPISKLI